jgi:hypothetical protein
MLRRPLFRSRVGLAAMLMVATLTVPATAAPAALPSPLQFVANLDLECFRTTPYTPPQLPTVLTLSHLNPVLADQPRWTANGLGVRSQLCTPVAKNDVLPPREVLEFIQFVDLSCYRISGPTIKVPLVLSHLNPLLERLPRREVVMMAPEQLCVPVIKNESVPPDEVLKLVRYIDLACYGEDPQASLDLSLKLTQLNPVLKDIPPAKVKVTTNRQLCVPVRKNNQDIPGEILKIVQWIDLEKFDISVPSVQPGVDLKLRHINPMFERFPTEPATLLDQGQLALPVAKNGNIPPG